MPGVKLSKLSLVTNAYGEAAGPPALLARRQAAIERKQQLEREARTAAKAAAKQRRGSRELPAAPDAAMEGAEAVVVDTAA